MKRYIDIKHTPCDEDKDIEVYRIPLDDLDVFDTNMIYSMANFDRSYMDKSID